MLRLPVEKGQRIRHCRIIGKQTKEDMKDPDQLLYNYLKTGKKVSKSEADYREQQQQQDGYRNQNDRKQQTSCDKCKFNLPAEQICHIAEGKLNNDTGISKHFSPKGHGILPVDIVLDYVKKSGEKLDCNIGRVIKEAADDFKSKDCKCHMYSHRCFYC